MQSTRSPDKKYANGKKVFVLNQMLKSKFFFTYYVESNMEEDKLKAFEILQAWRSSHGGGAEYSEKLTRFEVAFKKKTDEHPGSMTEYIKALTGQDPDTYYRGTRTGLANGHTELLATFLDKYPHILNFLYDEFNSPTSILKKAAEKFKQDHQIESTPLQASMKISPAVVEREHKHRNYTGLPSFKNAMSKATVTLMLPTSEGVDVVTGRAKKYKSVDMDAYSLLKLKGSEISHNNRLKTTELSFLWKGAEEKAGQRWSFFGKHSPADTVAECLAWGDPNKELKHLVRCNPSVLIQETKAIDYRGHLFSGYLFGIAMDLCDVFIKDKENETMVEMLKNLIVAYYGEDEFIKQQKSWHAKQQAKENTQYEDKSMLISVTAALNASTASTQEALLEEALKKNSPLGAAINKFITQLKKPGDDLIHQTAWMELKKNYETLGGDDSIKINFFRDQIIRLVQLFRLTASELQVFHKGLRIALNDAAAVPRVDIRSLTFDIHARHCSLAKELFCFDLFPVRSGQPNKRNADTICAGLINLAFYLEEKKQLWSAYATPKQENLAGMKSLSLKAHQ